jgi:hypothetical protein
MIFEITMHTDGMIIPSSSSKRWVCHFRRSLFSGSKNKKLCAGHGLRSTRGLAHNEQCEGGHNNWFRTVLQ